MIKRLSNLFRRGERGFTLIELLVVVAILGILAAVAIPNVSKFIGTGTKQAAVTEERSVQNAVIAAMADVNVSSVTAGTIDGTATGDFDVNGLAAGGSVGAFITGGNTKLLGEYDIATDGTVTGTLYKGAAWPG